MAITTPPSHGAPSSLGEPESHPGINRPQLQRDQLREAVLAGANSPVNGVMDDEWFAQLRVAAFARR